MPDWLRQILHVITFGLVPAPVIPAPTLPTFTPWPNLPPRPAAPDLAPYAGVQSAMDDLHAVQQSAPAPLGPDATLEERMAYTKAMAEYSQRLAAAVQAVPNPGPLPVPK